MKIIDTHAHIYSDQFDGDLDQIIRNAQNVGVQQILMPNIDSTSLQGMLDVERKYPGI
ncbi:TatD family hydrolase, partial [Cyclobacteriaceae bacterium]|nr:TatD family hydrolase [Cyclobacteriaceae bacterium]